MEIMHILVAGSLVIVGLTTLGYAGAVSGFVNRDLFTIPIVNIAITPLALMGLGHYHSVQECYLAVATS